MFNTMSPFMKYNIILSGEDDICHRWLLHPQLRPTTYASPLPPTPA